MARTFQRLFGETNIERKCRWLLGGATFILMFGSFITYAYQTETLAYDQLAHTGRTLVTPILARSHVKNNKELRDGFDEFQHRAEESWPERLKGYTYRMILTDSTEPNRAPTADDQVVLRAFREDPNLNETTKPMPGQSQFLYNGAIRAGASCVKCHRDADKLEELIDNGPEGRKTAEELANPNLRPGDLMGVVSVQLSTEMIESGLHENRALLFTFAIGTTLLLLAGSYLVIRYVVVRPLKHLKSVSEAIAAGDTSIRSDIHTSDEFEDLSVAFNRMLTNLIQVQKRNRSLIESLDKKIDELASVNLELFQKDKLKTDFLSTMSHELRTPLNHVIGFSENLLQAENLTEKQHRYAANIHSAGQVLLTLINDVLELAKAESGQMRARSAPLDYVQLCEQIGMVFRVQAEKKNIEVVLNMPEVRPIVQQDAGKLRQILSNLMSNAVKFTPEGGRVTLSARDTDEQIVICVADTGVGIPAEEQAMIFQKFRQASNPLTREQPGTGLGLSIVRELARLLGGDVAVQSELGRGSTFTVNLKRNLPEDPMAALEV